MFRHRADVPQLVPQLSRGKHRNPRKGGCFMEMASYLAGERWSDHPDCTHPLLATLARLVNDYTTDGARNRLIGLVPSVIGLTSDDPRVDAEITLRSATTALPDVAAERQRVLAVSVLVAERVIAELDGRPADQLGERSRAALAGVPHAAQWAENFMRETGGKLGTTLKGFQRHAAPNTVRHAVVGLAQACAPDPDERLHDLLVATIGDCERLIRPGQAAPAPRVTEWPVKDPAPA